jgi:hypothetical protein
MGVIDLLKKLFPPGTNPLLAMEPHCVRYQYLTFRLPAGWTFTHADGGDFKASGPGACSVEAFFFGVRGGQKAAEFEKRRKETVALIRKFYLEGKEAVETMLPSGVLWMEAADSRKGQQWLRFVLLNTRPRYSDMLPPMLQVTCTRPAPSGATVTDHFEELRTALRNIEWN